MNKLALDFGHRKGETFNNGSTKTERKYIDFIVSGHSLGKLFRSLGFDLIGNFGWTENIEYENNQIDEFLGIKTPELKSGRTSFYVCPECGDIGCGAITAKIEFKDMTVIWIDFGYENDYSEPELENYREIGPFTFDKEDYFKTFKQLKKLMIE